MKLNPIEEPSPFPFTEEEVISGCVKAAGLLCKRSRNTGGADINACLEEARSEFKRLYREARGYSRSTALKADHVSEMDALYLVTWPEIERKVQGVCLEYGARQKAHKITVITAESCVRSALEEAGFKVLEVDCQCYRVKVSVFIPSGKYRVAFIVKYKDILDGHLDEYVADFVKFTGQLSALPFCVNVRK